MSLPPGWECALDPGGNTYYYNEEEGKSCWDPPPGSNHFVSGNKVRVTQQIELVENTLVSKTASSHDDGGSGSANSSFVSTRVVGVASQGRCHLALRKLFVALCFNALVFFLGFLIWGVRALLQYLFVSIRADLRTHFYNEEPAFTWWSRISYAEACFCVLAIVICADFILTATRSPSHLPRCCVESRLGNVGRVLSLSMGICVICVLVIDASRENLNDRVFMSKGSPRIETYDRGNCSRLSEVFNQSFFTDVCPFFGPEEINGFVDLHPQLSSPAMSKMDWRKDYSQVENNLYHLKSLLSFVLNVDIGRAKLNPSGFDSGTSPRLREPEYLSMCTSLTMELVCHILMPPCHREDCRPRTGGIECIMEGRLETPMKDKIQSCWPWFLHRYWWALSEKNEPLGNFTLPDSYLRGDLRTYVPKSYLPFVDALPALIYNVENGTVRGGRCYDHSRKVDVNVPSNIHKISCDPSKNTFFGVSDHFTAMWVVWVAILPMYYLLLLVFGDAHRRDCRVTIPIARICGAMALLVVASFLVAAASWLELARGASSERVWNIAYYSVGLFCLARAFHLLRRREKSDCAGPSTARGSCRCYPQRHFCGRCRSIVNCAICLRRDFWLAGGKFFYYKLVLLETVQVVIQVSSLASGAATSDALLVAVNAVIVSADVITFAVTSILVRNLVDSNERSSKILLIVKILFDEIFITFIIVFRMDTLLGSDLDLWSQMIRHAGVLAPAVSLVLDIHDCVEPWVHLNPRKAVAGIRHDSLDSVSGWHSMGRTCATALTALHLVVVAGAVIFATYVVATFNFQSQLCRDALGDIADCARPRLYYYNGLFNMKNMTCRYEDYVTITCSLRQTSTLPDAEKFYAQMVNLKSIDLSNSPQLKKLPLGWANVPAASEGLTVSLRDCPQISEFPYILCSKTSPISKIRLDPRAPAKKELDWSGQLGGKSFVLSDACHAIFGESVENLSLARNGLSCENHDNRGHDDKKILMHGPRCAFGNVRSLSGLRELDLADNKIDVVTNEFSSLIGGDLRRASLRLRGNPTDYVDISALSNVDAQFLLRSVLEITTLKSISFVGCHITFEQFLPVATYLGKGFARVEELRFSGNFLQSEGLTMIAEVLSHGLPTLNSLLLGFNMIDGRGVAALAEVLPRTNIRKLELDANPIGVDGTEALFKVLPSTKIDTLHLTAIKPALTVKSAELLGRSLSGSKVTHLNLELSLMDRNAQLAFVGVLGNSRLAELKMFVSDGSVAAALLAALNRTRIKTITVAPDVGTMTNKSWSRDLCESSVRNTQGHTVRFTPCL